MSAFSRHQSQPPEKANCPHANMYGTLLPIPESRLRAVTEMVDVLGNHVMENPSLLPDILPESVQPQRILNLRIRLGETARGYVPRGKEADDQTEIHEKIIGASIRYVHESGQGEVRTCIRTAAGSLIEAAQAANAGPVERAKKRISSRR